MNDTLRAPMPKIICSDCGKRGAVLFKHWGALVPAGQTGFFCYKCFYARRDYYLANNTAKPLL